MGGRPLACCWTKASHRWDIRRSLSCPGCARAIRSASRATIARTTGWKFPSLTSARPGTDSSGLPEAAFSFAVTVHRAAVTYSRVHGGNDRRVGYRDGVTCPPPLL